MPTASTIESTRLALTSFPTPLIGRNLMAHLRSNLVVRIRRSAFGAGLPKQLEAAALLVRGSTASGRYHLQVTAAAAVGPNPENFMFRMMPDIDQVEIALAAQGSDWIVLILRGIGELQGVRDPSSPKQTGVSPSWVDLSPYETDEFGARRAWINLGAGPDDLALWDVMDTASVALAQKLAKNSADIEYFYDGSWHSPPPPAGTAHRPRAGPGAR